MPSRVDFSVQEDRVRLIPGTYLALVESVEPRASKSTGRVFMAVTCVIDEEPFKGRKVFYYYSTYRRFLPSNYEEAQNFKPFKARITIKGVIYQGNTFLSVDSVKKVEQ